MGLEFNDAEYKEIDQYCRKKKLNGLLLLGT